jgi:PPK2 family polyphosphate:nucleotide phosphotransferase
LGKERIAMNSDRYVVPTDGSVSLKDYDPDDTGKYKSKEDAAKDLQANVEMLTGLQDVLYAGNSCALLLIFQAMDAAGKDSVIKHVMSGVNPQGCQVFSFKAPSAEELDHDYLWRCVKSLPERGRIGIFNRSYYEEVLVVRVHPEFLQKQGVSPDEIRNGFWKKRYEDINAVEKYLSRNGTVILKFFLNVSKKEQKERFLQRLETPEKNWKFSAADIKERGFWKDYMNAYEEMLANTSTAWAPWHVIPADHKWFTRALVAEIIIKKLKSLNLAYPVLTEQQRADVEKAREMLLRE